MIVICGAVALGYGLLSMGSFGRKTPYVAQTLNPSHFLVEQQIESEESNKERQTKEKTV